MIRTVRRNALALALLSTLPATNAAAAVLYEQALPGPSSTSTAWQWANGWCSPCIAPLDKDRVFASFALGGESELLGGSFAVIDTTPSGPQDISVSIWDKPFGTELFSATFAADAYARDYEPGSPSKHFAQLELPGWTLGPGSYWISLFGINGNSLTWGSDGRSGDDHIYRDGTLRTAPGSDQRYVGFSLFGNAVAEVPLPGTLGLLGLGLAGLLAFGRRARGA